MKKAVVHEHECVPPSEGVRCCGRQIGCQHGDIWRGWMGIEPRIASDAHGATVMNIPISTRQLRFGCVDSNPD